MNDDYTSLPNHFLHQTGVPLYYTPAGEKCVIRIHNINGGIDVMDYIGNYDILLAFLGCLLFSAGLHYKKEGENIKYGQPFGFAQNLNWKGTALFFVGLILVIFGAMSRVD